MNFHSMVAVSTGDMFSGEAESLKLLIELEANWNYLPSNDNIKFSRTIINNVFTLFSNLYGIHSSKEKGDRGKKTSDRARTRDLRSIADQPRGAGLKCRWIAAACDQYIRAMRDGGSRPVSVACVAETPRYSVGPKFGHGRWSFSPVTFSLGAVDSI